MRLARPLSSWRRLSGGGRGTWAAARQRQLAAAAQAARAEHQDDRHQRADHDQRRSGGQVQVDADDVDAVLRRREERVEPADRERADDRAEQAAGAAHDEHRERQERQVEVQRVDLDRQQVDVQPAGKPRERAGERKGEQSLPVDRDACRGRRRRVLAGGAQHAPEAAALVGERKADADQRADRRLPDPRRLRDRGERVQAGADLLVVAQHVVRDLEHAERRDAGGEPGKSHQRESDEEREDEADEGGEQQRDGVPDVCVQEEVREPRHDRRLLGGRHRQHAGRPHTERHEADVAEREHAGVADEDVECDDDRDLHERVEEVRLQRARHREAEQRRREDEHHRRRQLGRAPHTRSAVVPPRAKSPFGRTSRTRITAANRNVGRYWLWFVGRVPPRIPLAKPIAKPPSVADTGRFSPPSTTPARTTMVSSSAKVGVTSGFCTVSITATTAASTPETSTAEPITRFARTPSILAVRKSIAAARICSPTEVLVSSSWSRSRQPAATATETTAILRIATPSMIHGWLSGASADAICPSCPNESVAMLCSRKATAKVATSITAGDCVRSGRNTSRSIAVFSAITTAKQSKMPAQLGQPHTDEYASAYAPAITSWPYAKLTSRRMPKTSPMPTAISA